ncbi:MAG: hypothetical protein IKL51_06135, partial [Lachnospiraceae bacterium]|nr:hypothetical protein [Lachnospiraceae bacterium]
CLHLPLDSTSRWTPLVLAISFPLLGRIRNFHPLETCAAGRTAKKSKLLLQLAFPIPDFLYFILQELKLSFFSFYTMTGIKGT